MVRPLISAVLPGTLTSEPVPFVKVREGETLFDGGIARARLAAADPVSGKEGDPKPRELKPAGSALPEPAAKPVPAWKRRLAFVPNALTGLNATSGLAAILAASHGSTVQAALLIVLANVFDLFDGRAARALGVESRMGVHLDSLADVVSFGAAPAALIYPALAPLGPVGFGAAAAYTFAGVYRLARFNDMTLFPKDGHAHSDYFTGLPIPGGAGVVASLALGLPLLPAAVAAPLALGTVLLTAVAMASRLPYPAFKHGGAKPLALMAAAGLAAAAVPAALGLWSLVPAAVFGAYLLSGPAVALRQRWTASKKGKQ